MAEKGPIPDRDALIFGAELRDVAQKKYRASVARGDDGNKFKMQLYQQYQAAGRPDLIKWLSTELSKYYLCMDKQPEWVEDDPSWPFHDGKPMVFISQTNLPENEITKTHLTWETVLYLFGARVPYDKGYRMVYTVVDQSIGFGGTGDR